MQPDHTGAGDPAAKPPFLAVFPSIMLPMFLAVIDQTIIATALIDTVYGHRWAGVGPVRAVRFPALVALGMRDRGSGWDVEMLVRAVKLGLSCDEVALPASAHRDARVGSRALLHILRHATMR